MIKYHNKGRGVVHLYSPLEDLEKILAYVRISIKWGVIKNDKKTVQCLEYKCKILKLYKNNKIFLL
ncbi:hypothetical protein H0A61_00031 [Koleobacter methoxysyntrophicus]|uniref:Uncharacterized protein n=1 Tax=Koleobacter methoxysyntrophicus TaxID=2751313 RepID=A0A8A0RHK7_9FIRM|nr:hypothetical protein H0A61_00031 [Koleobacter methoxysyntrophicus]